MKPTSNQQPDSELRPEYDFKNLRVVARGPGRGRPEVEVLARLGPSETLKERVGLLIAKEKEEGLSAEETAELDDYLRLEHRMRRRERVEPERSEE